MNIGEKFAALSSMIGSTPLLEISLKYKGELRKIYVKAEYYNLTGSIKDRIALHCMRKAYAKGTVKPGDIIAEATSGNTGIAFSAVCSYLGYKVVIYMPDWMSSERINLIRSYGAEIRLVSKEEGGFVGSIAKTEEIAKEGGIFLPCQFSNEDNIEAHFTSTGPEIVKQLEKFGLIPDAIVAGVGTGGTVMGIGNFIKCINPNAKVYPLEPESSPTMSTGYRIGKHRIAGISDEFIPALMKMDKVDGIIAVDDGDSIIMAQMLSRQLGLGVGISSGANLLGALKVGDLIGGNQTIVTIFSDDSKKYLSTDYVKEEPVKANFLTSQIELIGYKSVK